MDDITKNYIKYLEDKIDRCYHLIHLMQSGLEIVHDVIDHTCADVFPIAEDIIPPDWKPKRGGLKKPNDDTR